MNLEVVSTFNLLTWPRVYIIPTTCMHTCACTCIHAQNQAVWYEGKETYLLPGRVVETHRDTVTIQDEWTGEVS